MSQNYAKNSPEGAFLVEALQWHLDHGMDELLMESPVDRTAMPEIPKKEVVAAKSGPVSASKSVTSNNVLGFEDKASQQEMGDAMMGAAQAIVAAQKLAKSCDTLEALEKAIAGFEGLSIRKNATNMVFSDGNSKAPIMVIGEAPGADEDIAGKPFAGASGQLLDRILGCINLSRSSQDLDKVVYLSNILNWRPPGNRTPTQAEMEISLPFIERHIALVQPKVLILCGAVAAKSLLRRSETISKLRGNFHDYHVPLELQTAEMPIIPTIATYHPAYLLRTPAQKKAVWADMLMVQEKLKKLT